jgi:hypothetical protein
LPPQKYSPMVDRQESMIDEDLAKGSACTVSIGQREPPKASECRTFEPSSG